ncbi:MAG: chorismate-binding protein [Paludibacter sp.]|nr:chorismate-binding protein [Paludibacter sp.]MDD4426782.1 chorismate-binding protein [Paludibacter sp.]
MFRLPYHREIKLMIQFRSFPLQLNELTEWQHESGFLIAPFPVNGGEKSFLLQPDLVCTPEEALDLGGKEMAACQLFEQSPVPVNDNLTTAPEDFKQQVRHAIEKIKKGELYKVIVSKCRTMPKPTGFQPENLFEDLHAAYPHAFVYYWQLPGVGSWIGATPEPLMREQHGRIYTVSLAGTQSIGDQSPEDVPWKEKEIAEQAIVSRFIVQLLDKNGVETMDITGPHNFRAGNLVHLNTGFEFDASQLKISRGRFMSELHPTPSVAGLPRDISLDLIRELETHNRSYFSGLLGPLGLSDESHIYVNLRCMQLFDDEFVLYSGAGITGNSDPEKEWIETDNKMKTLLNVMHVGTAY